MTPQSRTWLLTWTCYGNWLPGDARGFVSTEPETGILRNEPGTPFSDGNPQLYQRSRELMQSEVMRLTLPQAEMLLAQFQETATYRVWCLLAVAIMANHVHLVVTVPGDPDPETLLQSFKSYGSRRLNQHFGKRDWWTKSGSTRKLPDERAVLAAVEYVRKQNHPLLIWTAVPGEPTM